MLIPPKSHLLFIGDSITDSSRKRDWGHSSPHGWLGSGYVYFIDQLIKAFYPEWALQVTNRGIGGHTIRDLEKRWQADLIDEQPDFVSLMIGINDVDQRFRRPDWPCERIVEIEEYTETLDRLIRETRALPQVQQIVLMTPFFAEPNTAEPERMVVDQYSDAVRSAAERYDTVFVNTQAVFDAYLSHHHPVSIAQDRIHPGPHGHMLIARAFLDAIGFDWNRR